MPFPPRLSNNFSSHRSSQTRTISLQDYVDDVFYADADLPNDTSNVPEDSMAKTTNWLSWMKCASPRRHHHAHPDTTNSTHNERRNPETSLGKTFTPKCEHLGFNLTSNANRREEAETETDADANDGQTIHSITASSSEETPPPPPPPPPPPLQLQTFLAKHAPKYAARHNLRLFPRRHTTSSNSTTTSSTGPQQSQLSNSRATPGTTATIATQPPRLPRFTFELSSEELARASRDGRNLAGELEQDDGNDDDDDDDGMYCSPGRLAGFAGTGGREGCGA